MRAGTLEEYNRLTSIPNLKKSHMETRRVQTVTWRYCSAIVAEKTTLFTYTKPTGISYTVNPLFLELPFAEAYQAYLKSLTA